VTRYALFLALFMALVGAIYAKGRVDGKQALQSRIEAAQEAAREAMRKAEKQRLIDQAERDRLARELEDMANADPVLVPQCLSPDRLRRLNEIR
jgi:hypothetical protein